MRIDRIPIGWEILKIGDKQVCFEIQPGFACGKKDVAGGTPHLRMNNISTNGNVDFSLVRRIPTNVAQQKKRWLEPGDIIFCVSAQGGAKHREEGHHEAR